MEKQLIIGITFSAFDLLHAGHIKMLEEAKIDGALLERLGDGMRALGDNAAQLKGVTSAAAATDSYVSSLQAASDKVSNLSEAAADILSKSVSGGMSKRTDGPSRLPVSVVAGQKEVGEIGTEVTKTTDSGPDPTKGVATATPPGATPPVGAEPTKKSSSPNYKENLTMLLRMCGSDLLLFCSWSISLRCVPQLDVAVEQN